MRIQLSDVITRLNTILRERGDMEFWAQVHESSNDSGTTVGCDFLGIEASDVDGEPLCTLFMETHAPTREVRERAGKVSSSPTPAATKGRPCPSA